MRIFGITSPHHARFFSFPGIYRRLGAALPVRRCLAFLLWGVLLSACATVTPPRSSDDGARERAWQAHLQRMAGVTRWELRGRIAVKGPRAAWQAHLVWRQHPGRFEIDLLSAFGQHLARLRGDAGGIELLLPEGQRYRARDAESLLQERLGWSLPLAGLYHWVRGVPVPGEGRRRVLDAAGRLAALEQQGWRIDYGRYRSADGFMLPGKVVLVRKGLRLRLVVDRWTLETVKG